MWSRSFWDSRVVDSVDSGSSVVIVPRQWEKLTTDSKDCGRIGKLFEDNFLFKECLWSYTKEDVIQKITALPAGVSMEFSLESAKRAIHGQIEYIVSIAGPGMDKIQAQFVYCPFTNDLKSGNVPKCN
ncbi:hypothetical protein L3Y34_014216 [Caenorhabditis briggsae]|uniref:NTF2-like domain-containing protein n=1 Tax=Caenorhabditis briggsae TaxID=6238 RepID=A0AAE9IXR9_CAEBR|nr:hypothetical protein L3Y34_014216 [Caenorhabditis briggsae]